MFPRRICPSCGRSIALGTANQIRSHFCPHYKTCELGTCETCADDKRDDRHAAPSPEGAVDA